MLATFAIVATRKYRKTRSEVSGTITTSHMPPSSKRSVTAALQAADAGSSPAGGTKSAKTRFSNDIEGLLCTVYSRYLVAEKSGVEEETKESLCLITVFWL